MATLADSLVSSSARRLPLRKRPDLTAKRQTYQGQSYWIVKEPVGLNYFRFQEEEYAILQMLDGSLSLEGVKERFEEEFPPQKITVEELQQFVGMLHKSGLIIADAPGQGHQLRKRRDERKRKELLAALSNVLAIRFKGVDPDRFLNWLYPKVRLLFTRTFVIGSLLMSLAALLLIIVEFDVFQSKLPAFHQFFSAENAIWLAVALAVTKVIHELGHGLTCKHFGGECHEIGVLILVLTPCLYCNVSDSWLLPNKWHRAAIGAAGMFVEVVMAGLATFIWWFSEPGLLNHLCLSVMFVCSVSTIIFNGNPLLRYDGYYILSDIVEIPNLRQKSSSILARKAAWLCLGMEMPEDPFLPQRNQAFFALYTVASVLYRWFVVISILFFLNKVFEPYGLQVIGRMIALMALYGLVVHPFWKLYKFLSVPGRLSKVKRPRLLATLAVVGALVAAATLIPLPHRVFSSLIIEPRDATPVYVEVPGRLDKILVRPGKEVRPGERLARLSSLDVEMEIARLKGELARTEEQLVALKRRAFSDPAARSVMPEIEKARDALQKQLTQKQEDAAMLTLVSTAAGTVLPPAENPAQPGGSGTLPTWSATPLHKRNEGAFLEEGTLFCRVGDPTKWEAILVIDQSDMSFLKVGQRVDIKLDELPLDEFPGTIADISVRELEDAPKNISNKAGGDVPTKTDESGREVLLTPSYQARVELDDPRGLLRIGLTGRAKIYARKQTLAQKLSRQLAETFNFHM